MEKWILAVGYDMDKFAEAQAEWLKYGMLIRMAPSMQDAMTELKRNDSYLLVAIFFDQSDTIAKLKILRDLTHAPILMMTHQYTAAEKVAALDAGADEYIQWPKSVVESVASGLALMRHCTKLNQRTTLSPNVLSCGDVLISVDYRKVFVHTVELNLPRREFDLFFLLVSNPERVFQPEQLLRLVWGDDCVPSERCLYSCIHRIRSKLEAIAETPCQILNKRGVGYCFSQKST